jgi:ubiquinone/menaquinone biosynthesis C-methylase UbiE
MQYLARLVERPGVEVHVLELAGSADHPDRGDAGELLDPTGFQAYRARLAQLRDAAEDAEAIGDPERAERARSEMEAIASELARATGRRGQPRRAESAVDRARSAVQRRIKDALDRIAELETTAVTGRRTDDRQARNAVPWIVTPRSRKATSPHEENVMDSVLSQQSFPEIYERVLVPSIFEPWARDLIDRARPIGPSDRILDLGCGTGIVARLLRDRLGGATRIVGLDANPQMIATARRLAPELEWREANAMSLPFEDGAFELVMCQEMLQFVPDRAAAAREIRRVLEPGGRLIASTWRPRAESPLLESLGVIAERHLGTSNDKRHALGDSDELRAMLVGAGFTDVRVELVSRIEHYASFPVRISAMAMNFELASLPEAERERRFEAVEADSAAVLARFATGGSVASPVRANVVTAIAPVGSGS